MHQILFNGRLYSLNFNLNTIIIQLYIYILFRKKLKINNLLNNKFHQFQNVVN